MSQDKSINPSDLPQSEAYNKKDVFQQKHLADMGHPNNEKEKLNNDLDGKPADRTSTEDGLNQESSTGKDRPREDHADI